MEHPIDDRTDVLAAQRSQLRSRHSQALAKLMAERGDLRGVNDLADLVDDSLRWSA